MKHLILLLTLACILSCTNIDCDDTGFFRIKAHFYDLNGKPVTNTEIAFTYKTGPWIHYNESFVSSLDSSDFVLFYLNDTNYFSDTLWFEEGAGLDIDCNSSLSYNKALSNLTIANKCSNGLWGIQDLKAPSDIRYVSRVNFLDSVYLNTECIEEQ